MKFSSLLFLSKSSPLYPIIEERGSPPLTFNSFPFAFSFVLSFFSFSDFSFFLGKQETLYPQRFFRFGMQALPLFTIVVGIFLFSNQCV